MNYIEQEETDFWSAKLERHVTFHIYKPEKLKEGHNYPLLLLNDGQESKDINVLHSIQYLVQKGLIPEIICIGLHANENRLQEYGIANHPDFAGRGSKAALFSEFVLHELLPHVHKNFPVALKSKMNYYAGYSLGALSAFDIGWNQSEYFGGIGSFSGSFWWRKKKWIPGHDGDVHRICHQMVRRSKAAPSHLRFWFQAGTLDEKSDRNNNGIIDAIDDTLDLIVELSKHHIRPYHQVVYEESIGGEHQPKTWALEFPKFLQWAFGSTRF